MAIDIKTEVLIHRPRAAVAAFMFDPNNDATWTTGVIACRPLTDGPLRAGSRVERTVKFLGRQFAYTYDVVAAADARFVEMHVKDPFPMNVRYELEDADDGTLARICAAGEAGGFFKLAAPFMAKMVKRNITKDLALLKQCLERSAQ